MNRNTIVVATILVFPFVALAETSTFICDYKSYSDEEGIHQVENEFVLRFLIDTEVGKAYMIGNNGSVEVQVFVGDDSVSFVEVTTTQNIMTTAIAADGRSVHSRNSALFGELVPSQYYGTCVKQ